MMLASIVSLSLVALSQASETTTSSTYDRPRTSSLELFIEDVCAKEDNTRAKAMDRGVGCRRYFLIFSSIQFKANGMGHDKKVTNECKENIEGSS